METSGNLVPDRRIAQTDDDLKAILRGLFGVLAENPQGLSPAELRMRVSDATNFDDLSIAQASLILRDGGLMRIEQGSGYNGLILTSDGAQASAAIEDSLAWHFDNPEVDE